MASSASPSTKIKCLGSGRVYEGSIFAIDPVTQSVVLKKIEGDVGSSALPLISELGINETNLEKQEAKAIEAAERNIASLNASVSANVQTLFDKINFIFPSVWTGTSIVVLNEFIIDPPYDKVRYKNEQSSATSSSGMDRLVKVLEGERRKLNM